MNNSGTKQLGVTVAALMSVVFGLLAHQAAAVEVTVSADDERWIISDTMVGVHFVYSNEKDVIYEDGELAAWAREAGIGTGRYPGGTIVKFWDWENPTGVGTGDPWNPNWNTTDNAPPSEWMSLDEYLTFVDQSGIRPMFGVNSLSGHKYNRQQDSVDRAVRMVEYVRDRGYGGAIWYIGNEEENLHGGGIAKYARAFRAHAEAMKQADPTILVFWNVNGANANNIRTFLANDGGTADGLETHGKWPFGGDPNRPPGTFEEWLVEVPVRDRKNANRAWRFAANTYRNAAIAAGRPGLLIANNEYGLGRAKNLIGFDRYTKGLLLTDMLQEHFLGNWYSTAFWSNVLNSDEGALVSPGNNFRKNPVHLGLGLLGRAQGATMVRSQTDFLQVHGFSAKTTGELQVYLINKSTAAQPVRIGIDGVRLNPLVALPAGFCDRLPRFFRKWCRRSTIEAISMVDTEDDFGEYVDTAIEYDKLARMFTGELPPLSYTRIVFPRTPIPWPKPPGPVADLTSIAGDAQVSLSWSASNAPFFSEYRVYRGNNPNAPLDLIASNLSEGSFIDTGLVNGASYIYRVVAVDKWDRESFGSELTAVPVTSELFTATFNDAAKQSDTNAANLDAGTAVGNWDKVPAAGVDVAGRPGNNALLIDRVAGGFAIDGIFRAAAALDGVQVDFRAALRRTAADRSKDITVAGLDAAGNKSFELVLAASTTAGEDRRLYYVDPVNGTTAIPESADGDLQFMNDTFAPAPLRRIVLKLAAGGYVVEFNNGAWVSGTLPYSGGATTLEKIRFSGGDQAGVWLDAIFIE